MFQDRLQAARKLSKELFTRLGGELDLNKTIVLAIPKGGVPIGAIVAREFTVPLNILISKKIGHPNNPNFAIGAVTELEDEIFSDKAEELGQIGIQTAKQETLELIHTEAQNFRPGNKPFPEIKGKTIILVDDAIATGQTVAAAIISLRKQGAERIILAVPISSRDAAEILVNAVDDFICLQKPPYFMSISKFYQSYPTIDSHEIKTTLLSF
jgi:predicted phosphoribosyltransferase